MDKHWVIQAQAWLRSSRERQRALQAVNTTLIELWQAKLHEFYPLDVVDRGDEA